MRTVSVFAVLISFLSGILFVTRLARIVEAGNLLNSKLTSLNFLDNWIELLSVILPLVFLAISSLQFLTASRAFGKIVTTTGRDLYHLNAAISSLATGLYLVGGFIIVSVYRWLVWADEASRCLR